MATTHMLGPLLYPLSYGGESGDLQGFPVNRLVLCQRQV